MDKLKPYWFTLVSILALSWNFVGVVEYLNQVTLDEAAKAALPHSPIWVTATFAIAVWVAFVASILLILRKKSAKIAFQISLIAVLLNDVYWFFLSENSVITPFQGVIIAVALGLYYFSRLGIKKEILN